MPPIVLAIFTGVGLLAFGASGGHKAVEEKGFKESVKTAYEIGKEQPVLTQSEYDKQYND